MAIGGAAIWLGFGVLFGVLSGLNQGKLVDRILTVLAMAGISTPIFWLGAVMLYLFTFVWHGFFLFHGSPRRVRADHDQSCAVVHAPRAALDLPVGGLDGLLLEGRRNSLLEVQTADYVRTARAMGLSGRRVLLRHVLRTALIPVASLFALDFGAAVGGTVILIEPVFGINGVGNYAQQSVSQLDLPPLMALTLYGGFFIVIVNAIADVLLMKLDPRISVD